jgi:hypothetical protein
MAYSDFRAVELHFDTAGNPADGTSDDALLPLLPSTDHLIVVSHGWNNDIGEARELYEGLFKALLSVLGEYGLTQGAITLALVFWPSKKFDETQLIPGGAAGIDLDPVGTAILAQLSTLKAAFNNDPTVSAYLDHAAAQVATLAVSKAAQDDFVHAVSLVLPASPSQADPGLDDARAALSRLDGSDVLARLALSSNATSTPAGADDGGGAASLSGAAALAGAVAPSDLVDGGGAASFDPLGAIKNAALLLLNLTTYYAMKERAGTIGSSGVARTLAKMLAHKPGLQLHLAGHSFGGRLVTSAANSLTGGVAGHQARSLTLMQAAYSHYGLAPNYLPGVDGAFRSIITSRKVSGGIAITHSVKDLAVGLAYPLASAIAQQSGSAIGDANDFHGGMGRNGAQKTPEAFDDTLHGDAAKYPPLPAGRIIRNLNGDAIIQSHGDVARVEVARALLDTMTR